jgi:hypothetical protein
MIDTSSDDFSPAMPPDRFLLSLNQTAVYAATRGAAFFLRRHVLFLMVYVNEWVKAQEDGTQVAEILFAHTPSWLRGPITRLLGSRRVHARTKTVLLLTPLLVPLVFILPLQMVRSGANSVLDVLRHGVRSVPPLVTAVVVVFVTSDAWRILGKGFTGRFFALVSLFIVGGLFFLVRRSYWDDIEISGNEATILLGGIRDTREAVFEFIDLGAQPTPMRRPAGFGALYVRIIYLAVCISALIATTLFVAAALIIVGITLINANETRLLAGSVDVYWSLDGLVFTRQLMSLSLSLGAFASFFLIAAQQQDARTLFMAKILARARRSLLVYTIYCHAHEHATEWTGIEVHSVLAPPAPESRDGR